MNRCKQILNCQKPQKEVSEIQTNRCFGLGAKMSKCVISRIQS